MLQCGHRRRAGCIRTLKSQKRRAFAIMLVSERGQKCRRRNAFDSAVRGAFIFIPGNVSLKRAASITTQHLSGSGTYFSSSFEAILNASSNNARITHCTQYLVPRALQSHFNKPNLALRDGKNNRFCALTLPYFMFLGNIISL
jgi:hypothetical protein